MMMTQTKQPVDHVLMYWLPFIVLFNPLNRLRRRNLFKVDTIGLHYSWLAS
jgi:hypothetical protein